MRGLPLVLTACGLASSTRLEHPIKWSAPIEIATGGGERGPWQQNESRYDYVDDPSVALDATGAAAVVWVDNKRKDIFFQIYERDGRARSAAVNVSRTPAVFSWLPRVIVSRNDVFVLWQEIVFSGGTHGGDIFFARSTDRGASFAAPLNLSQSKNGDGKARLSKDVWLNGSLDLALGGDGTLFAAWTEYDGPLWFARSTDRGASFGKPLLVDAGQQPARAPSLAIGDGNVYLAWTVGEDPKADIRIATSTDAKAFGPTKVIEQTSGYSDAPKLAVDPRGGLHLVYAESAGGPFDRAHVRYLRSDDRGKTFEPARNISQPNPAKAQSAGFPSLAVDQRSNVFVTWELYRDTRQPPRGLGISYSLSGGKTFTAPALVGSSIGRGGNGSHQGPLMRKLAVRDGVIAVVNSALEHGKGSRVWLVRGELPSR